MIKPKIIAFYLPQFHPTKENDGWWEPGFTEWTNVAKAKPLFPGHYQPKLPGELGFYDLRLSETREKQAELARHAGIDGFCYWHYWFEGRRLLNRVFDEVLESGKPDFPFCLCWANHSWYKKTWNNDGKDKLLIEQTYGGKKDYEEHFYALLPAFKDHRYMKINGKLIFGIFASYDFKDFRLFEKTWNKLARENNISEFWFFGYTGSISKIEKTDNNGFENIVVNYTLTPFEKKNILKKKFIQFNRKIFNIPFLTSFDEYSKYVIRNYKHEGRYYLSICPNFDHSPRSGSQGLIITGSNPSKWKFFFKEVLRLLEKEKIENNILFIKAWNEWGEGNYLEPDRKFGRGYLNAMKEILENL